MKKLALVVLAIALSLPMVAWGASTYTTSFKDGKYQGTVTSVDPSLNGKVVKMELKHDGDNVTATVEYEGGKEVWSWNDKTLTQQEIDMKANKVAQQYGATALAAPAGTKQAFNVNCKDKTKNDCDAGIDARNQWIIEASPTAVKYTVFGVTSDKKADPNAKAIKKHEFTFNKAN